MSQRSLSPIFRSAKHGHHMVWSVRTCKNCGRSCYREPDGRTYGPTLDNDCPSPHRPDYQNEPEGADR